MAARNLQNDARRTTADKFIFYHLCELFDYIRKLKGRIKKARYLSNYVSKWRKETGHLNISSSVNNLFIIVFLFF